MIGDAGRLALFRPQRQTANHHNPKILRVLCASVVKSVFLRVLSLPSPVPHNLDRDQGGNLLLLSRPSCRLFGDFRSSIGGGARRIGCRRQASDIRRNYGRYPDSLTGNTDVAIGNHVESRNTEIA